MSELASPALNESSNGGSLNLSGEAAHDSAAHLLAQISSNDSQVQNLPGGDAVQAVINPLGEYSKPATVRNHVSVVELSLLPKLFWSFEPTEFHQAITAKIPALEQNLDVSNFVNFNLSVQTFLATIDSAGLGDVYTVTLRQQKCFSQEFLLLLRRHRSSNIWEIQLVPYSVFSIKILQIYIR